MATEANGAPEGYRVVYWPSDGRWHVLIHDVRATASATRGSWEHLADARGRPAVADSEAGGVALARAHRRGDDEARCGAPGCAEPAYVDAGVGARWCRAHLREALAPFEDEEPDPAAYGLDDDDGAMPPDGQGRG